MSQVSKLIGESGQSYLKRLAYINGCNNANAWTHLSHDKRKIILHNLQGFAKGQNLLGELYVW